VDLSTHSAVSAGEGVVSKVRDSAYASGRGKGWVKKTCARRETLANAGFATNGNKWDGNAIALPGRKPAGRGSERTCTAWPEGNASSLLPEKGTPRQCLRMVLMEVSSGASV
jgi:hypothetical protein